MRRFVLAGAALFGMATALGCSSEAPAPQGTLTVQGTVSQELAVDNARAVAVGANGRMYWAHLDGHRDFRLKVPVGQSYRIVIANERPSGGQVIVGRMVLPAGDGRTVWLGANESGVVDLGTLRPAGSAAAETGGVRPQCADCADGEGEDSASHDDDNECYEGGDVDDSWEKDGADSKDDGTTDKTGTDDKTGEDKSTGDKTTDEKTGDEKTGDDKSAGTDKSSSESDKGEKTPSKDSCKICKGEDKEKDLEPSKKPSKKYEDKDTGDKKSRKGEADKECPKKAPDTKDDSGDKSGTGESKPSDKPADDGSAPDEKKPDGEASGSSGGTQGPGDVCKLSTDCIEKCECIANKCTPL